MLTQKHQEEVGDHHQVQYKTIRPTVAMLETRLYQPIQVLDHGFVRVIDYMGDDTAITQAARVSYGRGTSKASGDVGLIRYLMRHRHTTPFEMCEIKFHVKLPIFVARQWIRHRTANVNEYSARYSVLDREFYLPDPHQLAGQSSVNHQGRGSILSPEQSAEILDILRNDAMRCYDHYEKMLGSSDKNSGIGLARELARMNLTLNTYTQWYWKIDLHNLLHFISLRIDPHAQYEIRVYADAMLDIVRDWVPITCKAFEDYRVGSFTFSRTMLDIVRRLLVGEKINQEDSGLSTREWREFMSILHLDR